MFNALGADTYVINNQSNSLNINNNADSTYIEGIQKFVVEKGLNVGFAYDGDVDRLRLSCPTLVCTKHLTKRVSAMLRRLWMINMAIEYMAKNVCHIGGEQSDHIIFSKYASTGEGILTARR